MERNAAADRFANDLDGAKIYRFDRTNLFRANTDGFEIGFNDFSFGVNYKVGLYAIGLGDGDNYFAEGTTRDNPAGSTTVTRTYQVTAGEQVVQTINVPATSHQTVGVRSVALGDGKASVPGAWTEEEIAGDINDCFREARSRSVL